MSQVDASRRTPLDTVRQHFARTALAPPPPERATHPGAPRPSRRRRAGGERGPPGSIFDLGQRQKLAPQWAAEAMGTEPATSGVAGRLGCGVGHQRTAANDVICWAFLAEVALIPHGSVDREPRVWATPGPRAACLSSKRAAGFNSLLSHSGFAKAGRAGRARGRGRADP